MGNNDKRPKIRFKGFNDDWEQHKVSKEVYSVDTGKSKYNILEIGKYEILGSTGIIGYDDSYDYEGDFLLTARVGANAGTLYRHSGKVKITDNTVFLQGNHIDFVFYLLDKFDLKKLSFGSGQPLIKASELKAIELYIPKNSEEKNKITKYFISIDKLISLHQRKLEKLGNIKKSMLEKMFPKDENKVPEIRFKGFNDDWEQRKLIEYLAVSKVKNKDEAYNKDDVLSVSGDYGIVNQIEFQGRSFAGASVTNYGVVATGDVVYTKSPLKSNPYGIIKTNKGKTGIVSTLYAVYKPLENTYPEFVQIYFEQDARMNNYMHPLVNKGAKNDMKVSDENALKGDVIFPQKEEQIKISEYFLRLDNLISLHQRKLEKLKNIKKACLEKMFV